MGVVGEGGGEDVGVAAVGELQTLAEGRGGEGEVAGGDVGAGDVTKGGLEVALVEGGGGGDEELTAREAFDEVGGDEEMAVVGEGSNGEASSEGVEAAGLHDGGVGLEKKGLP